MEEYRLKVSGEDLNQRLDHYLVRNFPRAISRSFVQRLILEGHVLLNGKPTKSHYKVRVGQQITITIPEPAKPILKPEPIPLDIVFEDEDLLVVNKPAGMVVHPAAGNYSGTLVNALLYHCSSLSGIGGVIRPGIIHRLDKDTSGLLVVAKGDSVHRDLARQFKNRTIKRKYLALVKGRVELDEGLIDAPIGRHPRDRKRMTVKYTEAKKAQTHYRVLNRLKDITLVELTLKTGRTHQARIHMAHIGHPVLGDSRYGVRANINRQTLHAHSLGFCHPATKQHLEFSSPLPEDMMRMIEDSPL